MGKLAKIATKTPIGKKNRSSSRACTTPLPRSIHPVIDHILTLQRTIGNQAVQRLLKAGSIQAKLKIGQPRDIYEHEADRIADEVMRMPEPRLQRYDETSAESAEGALVVEEAKSVAPEPAELNQWKGQNGLLTSVVVARWFDPQGMKCRKVDIRAGGQGGTCVIKTKPKPPKYDRSAPSGSSPAKAWILPGTGKCTVEAFYYGSKIGRNSSTLYITKRAAVRFDQHEQLHIDAARKAHDDHIAPLVDGTDCRVASHTGEAKAMTGTTAVKAEIALRRHIMWHRTIKDFREAERAANKEGGTVDIKDKASPTYPRDYGPLKGYAKYIDVPPGPKRR